ncbi:MAG: PhoH family protein [Pseudomonadota bacterium]|nr:PhoH family protein [Pseudomonadota bacterium]QKK05509.1 MAG: PhoH family protein [Pseudomonadota bacterium]
MTKRKNTITIRNDADDNLASFLFADEQESRDCLRAFEKAFHVKLENPGRMDRIRLTGTTKEEISKAKEAFYSLSSALAKGSAVNDNSIAAIAKQVGVREQFAENKQQIIRNGREIRQQSVQKKELRQDKRNHPENHVELVIDVEARNTNQADFLTDIQQNDVSFGVGPAGTGKTFLAAYEAVKALKAGEVEKIFLARPAVGNGKDLGALPGDEKAKLAPYLRPLYDELENLIGRDMLDSLQQRGVIEIAPVEFMRGRTFKNAFVILDEGQNTTYEQMKMALTRIGEGSKMVVTGDPKQTDLKHEDSGLALVVPKLKGVDGIAVREFTAEDIVRSPVVSKIVKALETDDEPVRQAPSVRKNAGNQPGR